jgi:hypothetical protein
MSDRDRRTILERRALFLGSALAALGCGPKTNTTQPADPQVVSIPGSEDTKPTSDTEPTPPADRQPSTRGDLPPLDTPAGVSERARQNYEALAKRMTAAHDILDEMEKMIPSCAVASCEGDWKKLAEKHFALDDSFRFAHTCPGSSAEAKAYEERAKLHSDYYQKRRTGIEAQIATAVGSGDQRYQELRNEVARANPRPCLSFACGDW